ncbi:hypothetical protein BU23DRAFT_15171 [Bimuria novae-zelandiae CBS 107.79]|uniref:Uncharacterized protein n=1 Tax=Bimuria novae-zelandiae CBS 107.79 TaxID=1447943 RepID=A0A6A5VI76_9PLEO|nr:hypothetical protein BU23DRAFT_15171 [Bimuria novae-zelandiae CBS 107.79]
MGPVVSAEHEDEVLRTRPVIGTPENLRRLLKSHVMIRRPQCLPRHIVVELQLPEMDREFAYLFHSGPNPVRKYLDRLHAMLDVMPPDIWTVQIRPTQKAAEHEPFMLEACLDRLVGFRDRGVKDAVMMKSGRIFDLDEPSEWLPLLNDLNLHERSEFQPMLLRQDWYRHRWLQKNTFVARVLDALRMTNPTTTTTTTTTTQQNRHEHHSSKNKGISGYRK